MVVVLIVSAAVVGIVVMVIVVVTVVVFTVVVVVVFTVIFIVVTLVFTVTVVAAAEVDLSIAILPCIVQEGPAYRPGQVRIRDPLGAGEIVCTRRKCLEEARAAGRVTKAECRR